LSHFFPSTHSDLPDLKDRNVPVCHHVPSLAEDVPGTIYSVHIL